MTRYKTAFGGVSIHAPARGATKVLRLCRPDYPVSIHAPARGATSIAGAIPWGSGVSIHAPARGATVYSHEGVSVVVVFQSTLPRGERPNPKWVRACYWCFNPRSRAGSDGVSISPGESSCSFNPRSRAGSDAPERPHPVVLPMFQSTLPRGERPWRPATRRRWTGFNPRSRAGSDKAKYVSDPLERFQSTLPRGERHPRHATLRR